MGTASLEQVSQAGISVFTGSHGLQDGQPTIICGHCGRGQYCRGQDACVVCHRPFNISLEPLLDSDAEDDPNVSWPELSQRICIRLKNLRLLLEISQSELGKLVGCDFSYISKIERGVFTPAIETFERLARGLDLELSELVNEEISVHDLAILSLVRSPVTGQLMKELMERMPRLGQHSRALLLATARHPAQLVLPVNPGG